MIVKDYQDGKLIILSTAFDTRAKILYIFYFAVFTCVGMFFMRFLPSIEDASIGALLIALAFTSAYIFAGFRFLNKALQTEKLIIIKNSLVIIRKGFLSKEANAYDVNFISNLRHLEKATTTKHPLAGQTFDYLGFQTEQQVISEMHGDNRIAFDYDGAIIKFGENIYSWDFEQIENLISEITGKDFKPRRINKRDILQAE